MNVDFAALEARLGHRFGDRTLLQRALTHPSVLSDRPDIGETNQRLEFLGDAVLQLVLTETLFKLTRPNAKAC
jgi:ribonuclease-3